jgi:hypothetical protein
MSPSDAQLANLTARYVAALSGGDLVETARLHAAMADVNMAHVAWHGSERGQVYRVFLAARAQGRLEAFLRSAAADGFPLTQQAPVLAPQARGELDVTAVEVPRWLTTSPAALAHRRPVISKITFANAGGARRVLVKTRIEGISSSTSITVVLPPGISDWFDVPMPTIASDEAIRIVGTYEARRLDIEVHEEGRAYPALAKSMELWLLQPNVALLASCSADGGTTDNLDELVFWIDSGSERVAAVLAKTLKFGDWAGRSVMARVELLYGALLSLNFRYMPSATVEVGEHTQLLQRVRGPAEILSRRPYRINCLDGAILVASLLERLGIDPMLAVTREHALVGWKTGIVPSAGSAAPFDGMVFLDPTLVTYQLDFDVAVSAAEGYLLSLLPRLAKPPSQLSDIARILDVRQVRADRLVR